MSIEYEIKNLLDGISELYIREDGKQLFHFRSWKPFWEQKPKTDREQISKEEFEQIAIDNPHYVGMSNTTGEPATGSLFDPTQAEEGRARGILIAFASYDWMSPDGSDKNSDGRYFTYWKMLRNNPITDTSPEGKV